MQVAAYCRVSSSSADQLNSYANQIDYYTRLAKKKKNEWNMVEIFADEGISGMKAKNRPEFQRMIRITSTGPHHHKIGVPVRAKCKRSLGVCEKAETSRRRHNL